jgi:hypothetical protein
MVYEVCLRQIRHSKRVAAKVVSSLKLGVLMGKTPAFDRGFSNSVLIVSDRRKLVCHVDVVDEKWLMVFLGLTGIFVEKVRGEILFPSQGRSGG